VKRKAKSQTPDWSAKLRPELEPEIVTDKRFGDRLLLPTPLLVAEEIARVPAGATLSVSQLRSHLAERFGTERTCPLMTACSSRFWRSRRRRSRAATPAALAGVASGE